ncbi:beta-galactosidase [Desmospora activa]|uniref:Beta-galactosidase n=1 Tax=Desmospora activa DSM 45169 TaxID=1121389 RepID=A0A2T4ZBW2_9BACL|nr:beta-galactosidase [Desmospora activa]PTM59365.1 beta-galactosidase [Desmospora activa DSM 45169]
MRKVLFGGDYNPEQWPKDVWETDTALFDEAHIDTVSVGIFMWGLIQKSEKEYDFTLMDEIMEHLYRTKRNVCLGTATAAHPAWMAKKYPDILRVDFEGRKRRFGQRHNSCPNSPTYQKFAPLMARKMAERYGHLDNIVAWHVNNEYGGICYSDESAEAFRIWLRNKYGSLEALNDAWYTSFWSHTFYDWDEIVPPNALSEHLGREKVTAFQGITLDYMRFNSDSLLANFITEKNELKAITPSIPVTTNMMGLFKPLNYFDWAPHLDFISWDNYPPDMQSEARMALTHDLMRGLKKGQSFWLMEQTPNVTACRDVNPIKRPGVNRLWSYQALAHGSDTVLYFQMRQSKGACEKYHGAIINHGSRNDTRVFKECKQIGAELNELGDAFTGGQTEAKCALLFDWDSWWAIEMSDGPSRYINYQQTIIAYYQALYQQKIAVDIVSADDSFEGYDIVVAPLYHMVKSNAHQALASFVARGGTLVTTYLSGLVDENNQAVLMDYPGHLKKMLGIWVEETDSLEEKHYNSMVVNQGYPFFTQASYPCNLLFDVIHPETAEVVAAYGSDYYQGTPVVTRNAYGKGEAWYIGSQADDKFLNDLFASICKHHQLHPLIAVSENVELASRKKGDWTYTFVLNHGNHREQMVMPLDAEELLSKCEYQAGDMVALRAKDVMILRWERRRPSGSRTPSRTNRIGQNTEKKQTH